MVESNDINAKQNIGPDILLEENDPLLIKTEMSAHLSKMNLIKLVYEQKEDEIVMLCPKCLGFQNFRKETETDMHRCAEILIYVCMNPKCRRRFIDDHYVSMHKNSITRLITINSLVAEYQTEQYLYTFKDKDLELV